MMNFAKFYCLIKIINRGPKTDPREAPQVIAVRPESKPFMDTYLLRLDILDLNQSFETPRIP